MSVYWHSLHRVTAKLAQCDATLVDLCLLEPNPTPYQFLDRVVMPLLDNDKDGRVTRVELLKFQIKAQEWAQQVQWSGVPGNWVDMLDCILESVATGILKGPSYQADPSMLQQLEDKLRVSGEGWDTNSGS